MGTTTTLAILSVGSAGLLEASTLVATTEVDVPPASGVLEVPAPGILGVAILATLIGSRALLKLWRRRQS